MHLSDSFADTIGFNRYHKDIASTATYNMQMIHKHFTPGHWAMMGGASVALYLGKEKRRVSPDIDILISSDQLPLIHKHFPLVENNLFGLSVCQDGLYIDFLVALNKSQRMAIDTAQQIVFRDMQLPVISVPHLMAIKMVAGRRKDMRDFIQLAKTYPESIFKSRQIIKWQNPDHKDDFDSLVQWAKCC